MYQSAGDQGLKLARVTNVYRDSSQERQSTEYTGAYAVDVVYLDSKLADTDETKSCVFLTQQDEHDYSYPEKGSIVGVDTYEGTTISYVAHISPLGRLIPRLLPDQRLFGNENAKVFLDTRQGKIEIEADTVEVDGSEYKNAADDQKIITLALNILAEYLINLHSRGELNLLVDGLLNIEGGRFSLVGIENSSISAVQALDIVVGTALQIITGLNITLKTNLGNIEIGNLLSALTITNTGKLELANQIGKVGVDTTGLLIAENSTASLKEIINDFITEVSKIVVAEGKGPNVGALTTIQSKLTALYK